MHLAMHRDRLGHGPHRPLGRAVGEEDGITQVRGDRRHVDDGTAAGILHQGNGVFAAQEHTLVHDRVLFTKRLQAAIFQ